MSDGYYWRLKVRAGRKYDPGQPREPAGGPGGGRWTSSGTVPKLGMRLRSGTRLGGKEDAAKFSAGSALPKQYWHGTRNVGRATEDGVRPSADESNSEPGISLTVDKSYAEGYAGDTGGVLAARLHVKNPIEFDDPRIEWSGGDVGEFYRKAREAGYDAVTSPNEVRIFDPSLMLIDIETTYGM